MYTLFPLFVCAIACAMLGSWLVHDSNLRRIPALAVPGWLLIAVLPVAVLAFVVAGWPVADPSSRAALLRLAPLPVAGLVLVAAVAGALVVWRSRSAVPNSSSGSGIIGRGLLIVSAIIIALTFLLSVLLSSTDGTLGGTR